MLRFFMQQTGFQAILREIGRDSECLKFVAFTRRGRPEDAPAALSASVYCSSLVTSCCRLLAWARAEMPVWLRISYLDRFDDAVA